VYTEQVTFSQGSRSRLTAYDEARFPGDTLFDRLARAVCTAGCLPRKELYEAWEVARRTRRLFRGGRVVDLGGGHGLLAYLMLILDDSSAGAIVVDKAPSACGAALAGALEQTWPRVSGRVELVRDDIDHVALAATDVVVASHACGRLTDAVIDRAVTAGARLAVLPCCHDLAACDAAGLEGWMEPALAIDAARALGLKARGYRIWTLAIPEEITPKNRLLLAAPSSGVPTG